MDRLGVFRGKVCHSPEVGSDHDLLKEWNEVGWLQFRVSETAAWNELGR